MMSNRATHPPSHVRGQSCQDYRLNTGRRRVFRAGIKGGKTGAMALIGWWLTDILATIGMITASDENLLTVLIGIWFAWKLLEILWLYAQGVWMITQPPLLEVIRPYAERVRGAIGR